MEPVALPQPAVDAAANGQPALAPVPDAEDVALQVRGLTKRWNGTPVLDDVDLTLLHGTAVRISGRNGAGKTTLLRIVAGLIAADSGTAAIGRLDPVRHRRQYHACVGFLSAGNSGLYARLTARQHLEMWARIAFLPRDRRGPAIQRSIERFALEDLSDRRVDRLSMGQRQRVRLALAFLHDPVLALLDEPRNSLDEDGVALVGRAVEGTVGQGGAVIWCCPDGEASPLSFDRSYAIEAAKLVERP